MRSLKHWTPRYTLCRILHIQYRRTNPDHPWITKSANQILSSYLRSTDIGCEFGSGVSTLWFARQALHLTSIEHDEAWYNKVQLMIASNQVSNVNHILLSGTGVDNSPYVNLANTFEHESLDFVLVDGILRKYICLRIVDKIKPGGILILDDINRIFPSDSRSPGSMRNYNNFREKEVWAKVIELLSTWRRIWTSDGISDTAIFFKPC